MFDDIFRNVGVGDLEKSELDVTILAQKNALRREIAAAKEAGVGTEGLEEKLDGLDKINMMVTALEGREFFIDPRTQGTRQLSGDLFQRLRTVSTALSEASDEDYGLYVKKFFPDADVDLITQGYNRQELIELFNNITNLGQTLNEAADIVGGTPNEGWDAVRKTDDFQSSLRVGDLDGAIDQFGSKKLSDMPRYLVELADLTGIPEADQNKPIKQLHMQMKAMDRTLFSINDLLYADELRNDTYSQRALMSGVMKTLEELTTRTEYDPSNNTVIIKPSSSTMTLMNALGAPKEILEVIDPTYSQFAMIPGVTITPDFDRIVEDMFPETRMQGLVFGGVQEDIRQNMRNNRNDLRLDKIDKIVADVVAYMNQLGISEFASLPELERYTQSKYGMTPDQIFDGHSIKLLLGTDRYSKTFFGLPIKPTFVMPHSIQETLLAQNGKYTTLFDYENTSTMDRAIAMFTLGQEGAMGYSRLRADQAGYSPLTSGYVTAQGIGLLSDIVSDPLDLLTGGVAKAAKVSGKVGKFRKLMAGDEALTLRQAIDYSMMEAARTDGLSGFMARGYVDVRIRKGGFEDVLDKQIKRAVEEELATMRPISGAAATDIATRAGLMGLGSLMFGTEAMAEFVTQRAVKGFAVGTARGIGTSPFTTESLTNQLQFGFAKAIEDVTGYKQYYNYVTSKAYLGSSQSLSLLRPEMLSVPAQSMVEMYHLYDLEQASKAGDNLYNPNKANKSAVLSYHEAAFNKLGIDVNLVVDAMETKAAHQHPQMLKALKLTDSSPEYKQFKDYAKMYGLDDIFDKLEVPTAQKEILYKLYAVHAKGQDMQAFVQNLSVTYKKTSKMPTLEQSVLQKITEAKGYTKAVYDSLSPIEQRFLKRLGINYGDEVTPEKVAQRIKSRKQTTVKYTEKNGIKAYEMGVAYANQSWRADVRVSVTDEGLKIDEIYRKRSARQDQKFQAGTAEFEPPDALFVQELIRHLADTKSQFDNLIVPSEMDFDVFIKSYTRRIGIADKNIEAIDGGYKIGLAQPKQMAADVGSVAKPVVSDLKPIKKQRFVTERQLQRTQQKISRINQEIINAQQTQSKSLSAEEIAKLDERRFNGAKDADILDDYYGSPKLKAVEEYLNYTDDPADVPVPRPDLSKAYHDASAEINRLNKELSAAESTYKGLGGNPEALESATIIEARDIDAEVKNAIEEQRVALAAEDISNILGEQNAAKFLHVKDDGTHVFRGPGKGNIQVKFFEMASGEQVMTIESIGSADINNLIHAMEYQINTTTKPAEVLKAEDYMERALGQSANFQRLFDMTSDEYRNMAALIQYSIDEGISISFPTSMDSTVGAVVLNELAYRLGVDRFDSKVEHLVTHNNTLYRAIDINPITTAQRSRKTITTQPDKKISGQEFGRAQKVLRAGDKAEEADVAIMRKWIGEDANPAEYLTTVRQNADITMMGMNKDQMRIHRQELEIEKAKYEFAQTKYAIGMDQEIAAIDRHLEMLGKVDNRQPSASLVIQTTDQGIHKIEYSVGEDNIITYDVSKVPNEYADVVTNALVREASSYSNIKGLKFKGVDTAPPTAFIEARDAIYERWGATDAINSDMQDSVPSRGALFAPKLPHTQLRELGKYHSSISYQHVDPRDVRVANDIVGKTEGGKVKLASQQLADQLDRPRLVGAVPYGKGISYDDALFAMHDQPVQHLIVTDASKGLLKKDDIHVFEKYYRSNQQVGQTVRDVYNSQGDKAPRIYLTEPNFPMGRSVDINLNATAQRLLDAETPVIAINSPYGYLDGLQPLARLLTRYRSNALIKNSTLTDKVVRIEIVEPGGRHVIETTIGKIQQIPAATFTADNLLSRVREKCSEIAQRDLVVNGDKPLLPQAKKFYLDQATEVIDSAFREIVNKLEYEDYTNVKAAVTKGRAGFEPVFYTDRRFNEIARNNELVGTYAIDFEHRADLEQIAFSGKYGLSTKQDKIKYSRGDYKPTVYQQFEDTTKLDQLVNEMTQEYTSDQINTALANVAREQESRPEDFSRITYSTRMTRRLNYNTSSNARSPLMLGVFQPFVAHAVDLHKDNLITFDELKTLIFGQRNVDSQDIPASLKDAFAATERTNDDLILQAMDSLVVSLNLNYERLLKGELMPSDVMKAYMAAVYSQQLGEISRSRLKANMDEFFALITDPASAGVKTERKFSSVFQNLKSNQKSTLNRMMLSVMADELLEESLGGMPEVNRMYRELGISPEQSVILQEFKQRYSYFDDKGLKIQTEVLPMMWANNTLEGATFMDMLDQHFVHGYQLKPDDMAYMNDALKTPYVMRGIMSRSNVPFPKGDKWLTDIGKVYVALQEFADTAKRQGVTQADIDAKFQELIDVTGKLSGLGPVKTPFMLSLLGLGYKTTMDSRQTAALLGSFMATPAQKKATGRPTAKTLKPKEIETLRAQREAEGRTQYKDIFGALDELKLFIDNMPGIKDGSGAINELLFERMRGFEQDFSELLTTRYAADRTNHIRDPRVIPYVLHQLIWARINDMLPHQIAQLELHGTFDVRPTPDSWYRQVQEIVYNSPYDLDVERWLLSNLTYAFEQPGLLTAFDKLNILEAISVRGSEFDNVFKKLTRAYYDYDELYEPNGYYANGLTVDDLRTDLKDWTADIEMIPNPVSRQFDDLKSGDSHFKMKDGKPYIFLDDKASLYTFIHENGHLLETMLGETHYQNIAKHLDHVVGSDGRLMLTRKGQEQFAQAMSNMVLHEDMHVPNAFEAARAFFARQASKISPHFGKLLGGVNDDLTLAVRSGYVDAPQYRIDPSEGLQQAVNEVLREMQTGKKVDTIVPMKEPTSKPPQVKGRKTTAESEQRGDVAAAQKKEFAKSKGLTQEEVLRSLLPSRWKGFDSAEAADLADKAFLDKARTKGIDVIDAARKFEAMRVGELYAQTNIMTSDPLVAMTARSVVPQSMVTNVARRARFRLETALGKSMDELSNFVKVDAENAQYHMMYTNQLDLSAMPYIDLDAAEASTSGLRGLIDRLQNGPMRSNMSERLITDLAGEGPHRLYLHEITGVRDSIIDNAIPTARARNKKLESVPQNVVSAVQQMFVNMDKRSFLSKFNEKFAALRQRFIVTDELEGKVTPQFYDVLQNIKSRTKGVENKFRALFNEARSNIGRPSTRTVTEIMQEMRRMLTPPIGITDVSLVMELSRNFDEFINQVNTNPTVNTLYTKTLTQDTLDSIVSMLKKEQKQDLSFQIQQVRDYISLREGKNTQAGRLAIIAEDAVQDIYQALNVEQKSNFKAFFVQSYIGSSSSILNQVEAMLVSQQTLLTHVEEFETVRQLREVQKSELTSLDRRREIEIMILDLFEIVHRRKRLIERRGGKILQSLGVTSDITSQAAATAYTHFYTGQFSVNDFDIANMSKGEYSAVNPPDGIAWKPSDINDIAIQFGYITDSTASDIRLRNEGLQEVFDAIGIQHKADQLDNLDAEDLATIANQIRLGTPQKLVVRDTLFSLATRLGSETTLSTIPMKMEGGVVKMDSPSAQNDPTGVYFEMFARMIAEDMHLNAAEDIYAVYTDGNLQKIIAKRNDLFDDDPITQSSVIKEEIIEEIATLLSKGDVSQSKLGYIPEPTRHKSIIRNIAKQVIDSSGFTIRQQQAPTKEMILPDGSRLLVHQDVEELFNGLMADFAPVGVAIIKDEPVDSFLQMTRRQFGEYNRLIRKANAADEIHTKMKSDEMKKYLGEELSTAFIDSNGDFGIIPDDQMNNVFMSLYNNCLHVTEAASYYMFKNNISDLNKLDFDTQRRILTDAYNDAMFVENNVPIKEYEAFLESSPGRVFSAKSSQFVQAIVRTLMNSSLKQISFDVLTTFKQAVTSGFGLPNLRYYFGNFIGGMSQLMIGRGMEGVFSVVGTVARNPILYSQVMYDLTFGSRRMTDRPRVMVAADGSMYTPNMISNMMTENSVGSSMVTAELGRQLQEDLIGSEMWRTSTISKSTQGTVRAFTNLNSKVFLGGAEALDNVYRVALFMERLDSGMSPSLAAKEVRRVMFDYADLTETEKNVYRQVFTFYSFMRKNTGLILSELLTRPSRVTSQMRLINQSVRSNVQQGYTEYAVNDFYHSRLALLPGTPIYNFLRGDTGGYRLTFNGLIHHPRIKNHLMITIQNAKSFSIQHIDQMAAEYNTDLDGLMIMFDGGELSDLEVAQVLGYTTPDGKGVDIQKFIDAYDLIQYTEDGIYTFELYSDVYDDKMYIFPALNAPDGLLVMMHTFKAIFGPNRGESAKFALNQITPIVSAPLTAAYEESLFTGKEIKTSRTLPQSLVENPSMSWMFQHANGIPDETWYGPWTKVRIRPASNQTRSDYTRLHKYGDEMYAFDSNTDAYKFIIYSTIMAAHPLMGRSEQQSLQLLDVLESGEFYRPAGMTHEELFADILGLRNVPISTYDAQMQKVLWAVQDRLRQYDAGYVDTEYRSPTTREITMPSRVEAAGIQAETKEKLRKDNLE